jgi:hypothetical protein
MMKVKAIQANDVQDVKPNGFCGFYCWSELLRKDQDMRERFFKNQAVQTALTELYGPETASDAQTRIIQELAEIHDPSQHVYPLTPLLRYLDLKNRLSFIRPSKEQDVLNSLKTAILQQANPWRETFLNSSQGNNTSSVNEAVSYLNQDGKAHLKSNFLWADDRSHELFGSLTQTNVCFVTPHEDLGQSSSEQELFSFSFTNNFEQPRVVIYHQNKDHYQILHNAERINQLFSVDLDSADLTTHYSRAKSLMTPSSPSLVAQMKSQQHNNPDHLYKNSKDALNQLSQKIQYNEIFNSTGTKYLMVQDKSNKDLANLEFHDDISISFDQDYLQASMQGQGAEDKKSLMKEIISTQLAVIDQPEICITMHCQNEDDLKKVIHLAKLVADTLGSSNNSGIVFKITGAESLSVDPSDQSMLNIIRGNQENPRETAKRLQDMTRSDLRSKLKI